jgi:hypothetical protein
LRETRLVRLHWCCTAASSFVWTKKRSELILFFLRVLERKKAKQHADFMQNRFGLLIRDYIRPMLQFCLCIGHKKKKETLLVVSKRWQIQSIWILGVHEFVLFVLDDVLCLLPKFSLRLRVYSAHLDP